MTAVRTPRHKMAAVASISALMHKAAEEEEERGEGWYDIHVQGRPHWDGTGNANHFYLRGVYSQGNLHVCGVFYLLNTQLSMLTGR